MTIKEVEEILEVSRATIRFYEKEGLITPHRYFYDMDDFYRFVYKDPVVPRHCNFSPGGCYIISKEQVLKNSKTFYKNLNTLR